jgi:hypothetical protein
MEITSKDGKLEGLWTSWHENGQKKMERTYKDGKEEGLATAWYQNGQKRWEVIWKGGKAVSETWWDKGGTELRPSNSNASTSQVPPSSSKTYTKLPDIDVTGLNDEVFQVLMKWCHDHSCPCGCNLSFAACRNDDRTCSVSIKTIRTIVTKLTAEQITTTAEAADFFQQQADNSKPDISGLGKLEAKIKKNMQEGSAELDLYDTKVTDAELTHLKGHTNLQKLNVGNTQVSDAGLVYLKELTKLQNLDLQNTQITNAGLVHLKDMADLKMLLLSRTRVTDEGLVYLKALSNLETLTLNSTQITDVGLGHLKGLANLKTLGLSNTQITDAGVTELQQALPDCKITK